MSSDNEKGRPLDKDGLTTSRIPTTNYTGTEADQGAILEWFERLYGHLPSPTLINIVRTGDWVGRTFESTDLSEIVSQVEAYARQNPQGVYHRVTTMRTAPAVGKRGDASLTHYIPGFWADVDLAGPGHKSSGRLPETLADAKKIVGASSLPDPTLWVHSGGGLYPYWLLTEPCPVGEDLLAEITKLSEDIHGEVQRAARTLGFEVEPMADLARVLRVPGTINHKIEGDPRRCEVIEDNGPTFTIAELRELAPEVSTYTERGPGNTDAQKVLNELPDGDPCRVMARKLTERSDALRDSENGGRHNTAQSAIASIIATGNLGHHGAVEALIELETVFEEVKPERLDHEWADMVEWAAKNTEIEEDRHCCDDAPEIDADEEEAPGRDGKIRINVSNKVRAQDRIKELIGTGPLSGIFLRGNELVYTPRIGEDGYVPPKTGHGGPAQVRVMTPLDLKTMIETRLSLGVSRVTERTDNSEGEAKTRKQWEPKNLSNESANHVYSAALLGDAPNLRELAGTVHTPLIRRDGSVISDPGYDSASQTLFLPQNGDIFPGIRSDAGAVADAVALVSRPVDQMPFVAERHRANWFGALFTPLLRIMYPAPYPMFVFDAPQQGSGKTKLLEIIRDIHGGVIVPGWPENDAEFGKKTTALLHNTTAPVIAFDNVKGKVSSQKLEALLTSRELTERLLGQSTELTLKNDRLWVITSNNASIGGDLARRTLWVTIDANTPRPYDRTGFKLDLTTWVPDNRVALVSAMLTIVSGWVAAGRPQPEPRRSDSYAAWDRAMAGLLSWAGISDEFGAAEEHHMESEDDAEWLIFLTEVHRAMGGRRFTARELAASIKETPAGSVFGEDEEPDGEFNADALPGELADKWSRSGDSKTSFTKTLGKWMANRANRYVGQIKLASAPDPKSATKYWVQDAKS